MKVVFLTGSLVYNSLVVGEIAKMEGVCVQAIIIGDFIYPKKSYLKGALRALQKSGLPYFLFKSFETSILQWLVLFKGEKSKVKLMAQVSKIYHIPLIKTKDINDDEMVAFIKGLSADLIISMIPQVIGDGILSIPGAKVINLHPGLLPEYRAFGAYLWPLVDDHPYFGYTIHFINDVIDGGDIIKRQEFKIPPSATVQMLYYLAMKYGAEGLKEIVRDCMNGKTLTGTKQLGLDTYPHRPWPDTRAVRLLWKKGYRLFRWRDLYHLYKNDF